MDEEIEQNKEITHPYQDLIDGKDSFLVLEKNNDGIEKLSLAEGREDKIEKITLGEIKKINYEFNGK